ncbi:MAG: hypothetical protein LKH74_05375 [Levilactobacillus sp.]|jgi:hypothetical protein|uniref:hypothetical protein n=1 Tax=Levilactobacillus sp. TaxID=2767919 RepID=UPI002582931D|nr:hypothetical protein [Levilactobacillus sp.]MCI1553338.1 hypothetical protein [Levilactobacillus sp.]MCI1599713.1 hypothetical protein [Levilactobacillus sp.]MCI1606096.1 hypothetical protein [Levilactobacillus sp.]
MNKAFKLGVTALVAISFGGVTATTADAATWHKGLPKFVRNKKFRTKFENKYKEYTWARGTKRTFSIKHTQADIDVAKNVKYQKKGKTYLIRGTYPDRATHKLFAKYYRVRKISNKKIKAGFGKRGKLMTMTKFKHFPRIKGQIWN